MPEPRVRRIYGNERSSALDTLALGFAEDPGVRRVMSPPFEKSSREFLGVLLDICLEGGVVWATPGSVAGWTTPAAENGTSLFKQQAARLAELATGDPAFASAQAQFYERHRPRHPLWFLCTVATRPKDRGRGLARAVITPGLRAADEAGVPAFLETDNPSNVEFYESLGFRVIAQERLDDVVVPTAMIRAPG